MENFVHENMEMKEVSKSIITIMPQEEGNNDIILKADDGREWTIKDKWEEANNMNIAEFNKLIFDIIGKDIYKYAIDTSSIPNHIQNKKLIEDVDNPLNKATSQQILSILNNLKGTIQIIKEEWDASKRELKLTDAHMRKVYEYNQNHKTPMPENLTDKEKEEWDILNGLDNITDNEVESIFGSDHPLMMTGDHNLMVQRLKDATQDFANWVEVMTEYRNLHNAYMELVDLEEEKQVEKLRALAENAEDEETKQKLLSNVNDYYKIKYLDFLADPLDQSTINVIIKAFTDAKKIEYWIKRAREKMSKIQMNAKFILEIAQFETRFLDPKYAKANNILLLYFLNIARYMIPDKTDDPNKIKVSCLYIILDKFITNAIHEDVKERVLKNIIALEDQILPFVPEKKEEENKVQSDNF